jgi:two-component system invasion response regulator UvrY
VNEQTFSYSDCKPLALNGKTSLMLVDDHKLIRESLALILQKQLNYEVIGLCRSAEEAISAVIIQKPDIVILDINLPSMNGVDALPLILKNSPGSKVLGMSLHFQPAYARRMLNNGASGYITKDSSCDELFKALEAISSGKKYLCTQIKDMLSKELLLEERSNLRSLSSREKEIIELIKNGLTFKEIADKLSISNKTVDVHRYNILKKLKLPNTKALDNFMKDVFYVVCN